MHILSKTADYDDTEVESKDTESKTYAVPRREIKLVAPVPIAPAIPVDAVDAKGDLIFECVPDNIPIRVRNEISIRNRERFKNMITAGKVTPDLCDRVIRLDANLLSLFPKELLTKEICETALRVKGALLGYVSARHDLYTQALVEIAVASETHALCDVPINMRTYRVYEIVLSKDIYYIRSIPGNIMNDKLCKIALDTDPDTLLYLPARFINIEMYKYAVEKHGRAIQHIPLESRSYEICRIAYNTSVAQYNWESVTIVMKHVPPQHLTYDQCRGAVIIDGSNLQYVPARLQDSPLCYDAIKNDPYAYNYIIDNSRFVVWMTNNDVDLLKRLMAPYVPTEADRIRAERKALAAERFAAYNRRVCGKVMV